jgi:Zn-dependent M28 family amino/carboxypeptidase
MQRNQMRSGVTVPWRESAAPPVLFTRDTTLQEFIVAQGHDLAAIREEAGAAFHTRTLEDVRMTVTVGRRTIAEESAPNVVGILRGSDPVLRDEYIVYSAHMDHVGVGRPVDGDSIFNGADDDASGTVAIIELAEAFASLPVRPRRSLIFMTVSGEEKGLFGSRWYSENPTCPLDRTVANVNIDMIGRNWRDTIVAIGKQESSLGPLVERIAAEHPELRMAVIDDPWPEESFFTRSDHYNFARKGVPILFFFSGTHADYHRPGDEAEKIDSEKMARIGRLIFYLGLEVANADERPQWDPNAYERVVKRPQS